MRVYLILPESQVKRARVIRIKVNCFLHSGREAKEGTVKGPEESLEA